MSRNASSRTWDTSGNSLGASCSVDDKEVLEGSHRSGVVGSDNGTTFLVGFQEGQEKVQLPKRLQQYQDKKKTASQADLVHKQKLAEERKRKFDENRAKQARLASEQAMKEMERLQAGESQKKWYQGALPK